MSNYLYLNYKPNFQKEIIATFFLETKLPLKQVAAELAAESSIGTWTKLTTMKSSIVKKLGGKVFYLNSNKKIVKIAYPVKLFEPGSIPQLLSDVAGNVFSLKKINNLRLVDLEFPHTYIKTFSGPVFGISGIRKITQIKNRPLIGAIMKPKLGLTAKEHAQISYEIFRGGVDLVKDDENLTNQDFNPFEERVVRTLKAARKAEKETGSIKICAFNVTAETEEMIRRAKFIKKHGGRCAMIDVVTAGFAGLQSLRKANEKLGLIIHGHRAMHSAFSRNPKHGISMLVLANLCRLAGVDQLHTGTVVGKMEGGEEEVLEINDLLKEDWQDINKLRENWKGIKPVLPIASGGLHPGLTAKLIKILGQDIIINFGGGLHGHPDGSYAGAVACRQAIEATMREISLNRYAKTHPELKRALEYWY